MTADTTSILCALAALVITGVLLYAYKKTKEKPAVLPALEGGAAV